MVYNHGGRKIPGLYVQIQTFDIESPVFYLAIWQRSEDLKHLIPQNRLPELQGMHSKWSKK